MRAALARRRGVEAAASRPTGRLRRSTCPASASSPRRAGSSSASTRSRSTPSSAATPTRTTRAVYRWLLERNLRLYGVAFAHRPPRRHLPRRPAVAGGGHRRRARPAARRGPRRTPTSRSTRSSSSASPRRSARSGSGGSSAASRPATSMRFERGWLERDRGPGAALPACVERVAEHPPDRPGRGLVVAPPCAASVRWPDPPMNSVAPPGRGAQDRRIGIRTAAEVGV